MTLARVPPCTSAHSTSQFDYFAVEEGFYTQSCDYDDDDDGGSWRLTTSRCPKFTTTTAAISRRSTSPFRSTHMTSTQLMIDGAWRGSCQLSENRPITREIKSSSDIRRPDRVLQPPPPPPLHFVGGSELSLTTRLCH